jgi:riboflavin kinase/FMN adenylyltransferase
MEYKLTHPEAVVVVLTFDPHPAEVFGSGRTIYRLQRLADRIASLSVYGVEAVATIRFDKDLAALSSEEFVKNYLVEAANARFVVIGEGFRFGAARSGDTKKLADIGGKFSFEVHVQAPVALGGEMISSTRIRHLIQEEGDIQAACELMKRKWGFFGRVVQGDQRGRVIGFPTANLDLGNIVRLKFGVYVGWARLAGEVQKLPIVMNVGIRPTFNLAEPQVEVHVIGVKDIDLYDTEIWVEPLALLREEKKFMNVNDLKQQIALDCSAALAYIKNSSPI